MDSTESPVQRNAFELSNIFSYEPGGKVCPRAEGLAGFTGMVGSAINALPEAGYGTFRALMLPVSNEILAADQPSILTRIHEFIGEPFLRPQPRQHRAVPRQDQLRSSAGHARTASRGELDEGQGEVDVRMV